MLTAFLFCCAGFGALALAMDRHREDAWPGTAPPLGRAALRRLGTGALLLALAAAVAHAGSAIGLTQWCVQLSLAALAVVAVAAVRPRRLPMFAAAAALAAIACGIAF
jgi:hypothetical protein